MSATSNFNPYAPSGPKDSRSPCPALNALANHSYIPHSGCSIPFFQLIHAMRTIYNLSAPLAWLLSIVGFLWCGHLTGSGLTLDLHNLSCHGRIEHDGSLAHADAVAGAAYAPSVPDPARLAELLSAGSLRPKSHAGPGALTFFDLARMRFLRDSALARPLDTLHAEIARGEVALILLAMGVGDAADAEGLVVPPARLAQWSGEERIPDGWTVPRVQIGLLNTVSLGRRVKAEVARLARSS